MQEEALLPEKAKAGQKVKVSKQQKKRPRPFTVAPSASLPELLEPLQVLFVQHTYGCRCHLARPDTRLLMLGMYTVVLKASAAEQRAV